MSKEADVATARTKAKKILSEQTCNLVRFSLSNVTIHWGQYSFIGGLIRDKWININFADVHSYNHETDTINFTDRNPDGFEVVHEATHALIDYTRNGQTVSKGVHEACAYVAETVYSLATTGSMHDTYFKFLNTPVYELASKILAHTAGGKTSMFTCSSGEVNNIISIMAYNKMDTDRIDKMNGIKGVP